MLPVLVFGEYKWPFQIQIPVTSNIFFLIQLSGLKPSHHQNMLNTQNGFYNHLRHEYNQQIVTNIKIYKQSTSI